MTSVAPDPSTITATPTATSDSPSATCNTAVPDRYGHVPIDACNAYYSFYPSFAGNAVFAVLFGLTMLAHLGEAIHFKKVCVSTVPTMSLPLPLRDSFVELGRPC